MDDLFAQTVAQMSQYEDFGLRPDVEEDENQFCFTFDMPGVDKKDIDIEVSGNQLIVKGERKDSRKEGHGKSRLVERRYGAFEQAFMLPEGTKASDIEADFENGVLTIMVPKGAKLKAHKVEIASGGRSKELVDEGNSGKKESPRARPTEAEGQAAAAAH